MASAATPIDPTEQRKTSNRDLSVPVERFVLPNGLVVLLSPDATTSSVLVWMTFRAGTLFEPPGRAGMAHLVEHIMFSGPTRETDYESLLLGRRARYTNAVTGADSMSFQTTVPDEELPLALWVNADRLGTLPRLIDGPLVERNRKVVLQERALLLVDQPYGLINEQISGRLFANPHPLHAGVIGAPSELESVTAEEVRDFASEKLVPANAILTVVGNFDPALARRQIEEGLGRLPSGRRAEPPQLLPFSRVRVVDKKDEPLSREPRVTMAWRFPEIPHDFAVAMQLAAQLLSLSVDGAFGMRIDANFEEYTGEGSFRMDVTLPHDEPQKNVQDDAEAFLRMLTQVEMPADLVLAANLALDRVALLCLDSLAGRAQMLSRLEFLIGRPETVGSHLSRHWFLERDVVRDVARAYLKNAGLVFHARPTRPRPARVERE